MLSFRLFVGGFLGAVCRNVDKGRADESLSVLDPILPHLFSLLSIRHIPFNVFTPSSNTGPDRSLTGVEGTVQENDVVCEGVKDFERMEVGPAM